MTKEPAKRKSDKPASGHIDRAHGNTAAILTDAAIKRYVGGKQRRRIRDLRSQGLFLVIEPTTGTKSFEMRFRRPDGRPAKIRLGRYNEREADASAPVLGQRILTLAAARELAQAIHRRRALGEDVIGQHKAEKHRRSIELKERESSTFGAALRDYFREYAQRHNKRWRQKAWLFGLRYDESGKTATEAKDGLAARWDDMDVRAIDAHDVWQATDEAKRIGIPGIKVRNKELSEARARALFVALSALFKWLHKERRIKTNPVPGAYHPEAAKSRDRVLTGDEIRWFWAATETVDAPRVIGAPKPFKPLLRLLLLTGCRLNEVAGMRRFELHDDGTCRLPSERTKNKRPHTVPLSPLAHELIDTMPDKGEFVFSTNGGKSPPSGWSRMKRRLDAAMLELAKKEKGDRASIAPWRLHDLRRTAVTQMVELGVPVNVIELVVNHVSGVRAGVAGTYSRSEMLPERKAALERWAAHVEGLVSGRPANVTQLADKARGRRRGKA